MENYSDLIKSIASKYQKRKIAVIGKGDSLQELNLEQLRDFLIINLNDSEGLIPGDLCFLHRQEIADRITTYHAAHYFAPAHVTMPITSLVSLEERNWDQDGFEHVYEYLGDEQFYLTDYLLLSVIKFCIRYQEALDEKVEVYFLGFDFFTEVPSPNSGPHEDQAYTNLVLKTQESYFKNLLPHFVEIYPNVSLHHVGHKRFSDYSILAFNNWITELTKKEDSSVSNVTNAELYQELLYEVMNSNKVIVVAEFTNNHIGDKDRLIRMIHLAKESGADMIKLQKRDVETFYTPTDLEKPYDSPFGTTLGAYRKAVELDVEILELVDRECRNLRIPWFTSVLDWNSFRFMQQFDPILTKLPSTISNHRNYLLKVGERFKGDLVISTGFTTKEYEDFILQNFTDGRNLFLLQCTSSYPTPPEACQISVVRHYSELQQMQFPGLIPGYSSHDMGSLGCMLAVAAGAKMIEKHVKLGDLDWVHFDGVALDLSNDDFRNFVRDVRKAEIMSGTKVKVVHDMEHHKYETNKNHN